ncbi:protein of unknown function [Taphrina deformans PYCC 5710]|uniref:Uncharacterized protein n=1 Tax=Taphrina deformans (strain PYCC 5710 / ATCC 11124 / CBS 356.35 / IMI 108563 / JCM 9778 / NBRC 8474) TaxID=1097556 RepID=R4XM31_TAPDE|nr:protein of unknown function [Taphrina deformans PYCC 5710]|eukprot:CCG84355.1 protein of unknown function [Taphrina deformans PYCC 5710]
MSKDSSQAIKEIEVAAPLQHNSSVPHTNSHPSHNRHSSRPSQDLAAHDKLVRKDSRARKTIPRDGIDNLDNILGSYHHEGPFDATLASRQIPGRAPVEAVKYGNSLALSATPSQNVRHSLQNHEPLDGTSRHASGSVVAGQRFNYDEEDVERDAGRGRWPEVEYAGSNDGGEFRDDLGDYDVRNSNRLNKKHDAVEMQGSSRGIVEYSAELDEVDDLDAASRVYGSTGNQSGSSGGILGGLKKRLSVKKH